MALLFTWFVRRYLILVTESGGNKCRGMNWCLMETKL